MKTTLHSRFAQSATGLEAEAILRSCVHCGFCNATCPTYLTQGDERDGPRGRIYLIKQMLETNKVSHRTLLHLDRCLTCRSCETTCPSNVQYGRLVDIGRQIVESKVSRPVGQKIVRRALRFILPFRNRFALLLRLAQLVRPFLPSDMKAAIPERTNSGPAPDMKARRTMLVLAGCVQAAATPRTNVAAARVLAKLDIALVEAPGAGCCGALSYHLGAHDDGMAFMRRNIDAWWPALESGAEAVVITASGCGAMVKEYVHIFRDDPEYADKAQYISARAKDLSEILVAEDMEKLDLPVAQPRTAIHCPCTLQHAQGLAAHVSEILQRAGVPLASTRDDHICCGSAGTYSLTQRTLSQALLDKKLVALSENNPERIVTANVGCQLHLATKAQVPVQHWIELLDTQGWHGDR